MLSARVPKVVRDEPTAVVSAGQMCSVSAVLLFQIFTMVGGWWAIVRQLSRGPFGAQQQAVLYVHSDRCLTGGWRCTSTPASHLQHRSGLGWLEVPLRFHHQLTWFLLVNDGGAWGWPGRRGIPSTRIRGSSGPCIELRSSLSGSPSPRNLGRGRERELSEEVHCRTGRHPPL